MTRDLKPGLPVASEDDTERMSAARGLVYGTLAGVGLWLVAFVVAAVVAWLLR